MQTKPNTTRPEVGPLPARRRWEAPCVIVSELVSNTNVKFNANPSEVHALTTNSIANHSS